MSLLPFLADTLVLGASLHGQAQTEMNQDACARYKRADQALNETCQEILQDYARDPQLLARLRQTQRAWIALREVHLEVRFPAIDKQAQYGTSYPARRCWVLSEFHRASHGRTQGLGPRHPRR